MFILVNGFQDTVQWRDLANTVAVPFSFTKGEEFFDQISYYYILKYSAPAAAMC
jgi:hypothetical protein